MNFLTVISKNKPTDISSVVYMFYLRKCDFANQYLT